MFCDSGGSKGRLAKFAPHCGESVVGVSQNSKRLGASDAFWKLSSANFAPVFGLIFDRFPILYLILRLDSLILILPPPPCAEKNGNAHGLLP